MADRPDIDDEAAAAILVRDLFSDQFDKLLLLKISDDAIIAGMHMALAAEMTRAGGPVRAVAALRAFADQIEDDQPQPGPN